MSIETVVHPDGKKVQVLINFFPACDGYELQKQYIDFVRSSDEKFRRDYLSRIMTFAEIIKEESNLKLLTPQIIDNHLMTWQNIDQIFRAILMKNGIDPESHAQKAGYWEQVGKEMAVSFIAELSLLAGPAFEMAAKFQETK